MLLELVRIFAIEISAKVVLIIQIFTIKAIFRKGSGT